jgi:uncharacterized protein YacL
VPEAKSRSKMVINVIKVVVNIFLPYLGLIIFMKKGGLFLKILQTKGKKDCYLLFWGLSKLG